MLQVNNKTSTMSWITKRLFYPLHNIEYRSFHSFSLSLFRLLALHPLSTSLHFFLLFNEIKPFLPNTDKLKIHFANERHLHKFGFYIQTSSTRILIEIHQQWSDFRTGNKIHLSLCVCACARLFIRLLYYLNFGY